MVDPMEWWMVGRLVGWMVVLMVSGKGHYLVVKKVAVLVYKWVVL